MCPQQRRPRRRTARLFLQTLHRHCGRSAGHSEYRGSPVVDVEASSKRHNVSDPRLHPCPSEPSGGLQLGRRYSRGPAARPGSCPSNATAKTPEQRCSSRVMAGLVSDSSVSALAAVTADHASQVGHAAAHEDQDGHSCAQMMLNYSPPNHTSRLTRERDYRWRRASQSSLGPGEATMVLQSTVESDAATSSRL